MTRLFFVTAAGLLTISCSSEPENPARAALVASLDAAQAASTGWSPLSGADDNFATLADGAETSFAYNVPANTTLRIIGRCGTGCEDLDLDLVDSADAIQASDQLRNNTPQIEHTVGIAGNYKVVTAMWECSQPTCEAAIRVLAQDVR